MKPMLPGKWHGRTYGYVTCSACDRLVADHDYEQAKECLGIIEHDAKKPGWRRARIGSSDEAPNVADQGQT